MQTVTDDSAFAPRQADPDAELLRAWADWLAAARSLDRAVEAHDDAEVEELGWALETIERLIEDLPAVTAAGAAVKLKVALAALDGTGAAQRFVTAAGPHPAVHRLDLGTRLLWGVVQDLERTTVPPPQPRHDVRRYHFRRQE